MASKSDGFITGLLVGAAGVVLLQKLNKGVLGQVRDHVTRDGIDPEVRALAFEIVNGLPPDDHHQRLNRIYSWVTTRLEWKPDAASTDRAASIKETLRLGGGDCDCLTTAFCTLAEAAGHRTWLLSVPAENPNHLLAVVPVHAAEVQRLLDAGAVVLTPGRDQHWMPFDPSLRPASPGALGGSTISDVRAGGYRIHPIAT